MAESTALVALDWGTTSCRAYRIDAGGRVLETVSSASGILNVPDGDFDGAFEELVGGWIGPHAGIPVLASGMIGSRQGWSEAPYRECPAGLADLAEALHRHRTSRGRTVWFVPGLSHVDADGVPDVIRGEETQIVGVVPVASAPAVCLLPGTHSKWALVENGRVTWFATFMTGEVYAVLRNHSILGRLMTGAPSDDPQHRDAFWRGLAAAAAEYAGGGGLLHRLFSVRSLGLFDRLPADALGAYLSGLLIGSEVAEARVRLTDIADGAAISVIGGAVLADLYGEALDHAGLQPVPAPADAAAAGLFRIARQAGLIEEKP